jgi:TPP-dependent pyruvate/acetoin dehydrogenase alpha subunit
MFLCLSPAIEAKTTRWERHSPFSSGKYDSPRRHNAGKKAAPIAGFRNHLLELAVHRDELAAEEESARRIVEEGVKFALASPLAAPVAL